MNLLDKYNVRGPRYTSFPTVPHWDEKNFSLKKWKNAIEKTFVKHNDDEGISLYIHLPFCEQMCTFCGCHKRITRRHDMEMPYINAVLTEWNLYLDILPKKPIIKELHLGGGTPTFFSPENLNFLITSLLKTAIVPKDKHFSFEGHPNNTTREHLQTLYDIGFRRVSFGVQDYNPIVQKAIHRIQSFESVKQVSEIAREIGYTSVGHDIIFGLPFQTQKHIEKTMAYTKEIRPDRIAFYSYAHVPWIKGNGQRGFLEKDIPNALEKRAQYVLGKKHLEQMGYQEIGMDHFALPEDSLIKAAENKLLHRNFMGYTSSKTHLMIGLGVSSISDSWTAFAQNTKSIEEYQELVKEGIIPVVKGHILSEKDEVIRKHILAVMCQLETSWTTENLEFENLPQALDSLAEMENDGLLQIDRKAKKLSITEKGRPFVRNACMAFDFYLDDNKNTGKPIFSKCI